MAVSQLGEMVSNLGFPVAAYLLMVRLYQKERESRQDERDAWLSTLEQVAGRLDTLETRVTERLDGLESNLKWRQAEFEDRVEQTMYDDEQTEKETQRKW